MNNGAQVVDAKAKADFCFLSGKNLLIMFLISEKCASQFPKVQEHLIQISLL